MDACFNSTAIQLCAYESNDNRFILIIDCFRTKVVLTKICCREVIDGGWKKDYKRFNRLSRIVVVFNPPTPEMPKNVSKFIFILSRQTVRVKFFTSVVRGLTKLLVDRCRT
jgi:hypothetical protein